jgi:DNA-binding transcriptional MerR regulator
MEPRREGLPRAVVDSSHSLPAGFHPQEIEKLASKKGVTLQSVKEVLQGLVDDDLVSMDKVGIQNVYVCRCTPPPVDGSLRLSLSRALLASYMSPFLLSMSCRFWSFPSAASVKLEAECSKLSSTLESLVKEGEDIAQKIEAEKPGKTDSEERDELQAKLSKLQDKVNAKKRELEKFSASDPERFEKLKKLRVSTRDGVNRWVDNLFAVEKWMRTSFNMDKKVVQSFFVEQGVPKELDYVE